ncbi:PQQ-dependent sugar dehydrogenase [Scytonema sp. UIC 10036]|uniref:PQQ-dependent sugar dehydrogenase n=1 Tax=Scytonema sp. UIC 10036 TaxID=2304196 RepID=UPI001FAAA26C|nr:PQQ-dependent sugar dehydrogenase [Scytonema sp. UIC 10036]
MKYLIRKVGTTCLGFTIAACSFASANKNPPVPSAEAPLVRAATASGEAQGFRQTPIVKGLERPWSMAWLPDGTMLISEKAGRLRVVRNGVLEPTPIAGVPEVLTTGQAGLMDVSIHPQFAKNRFVYLTYSHGTQNANRTRVARATFDGKALRNLRVIFEVSQVKSGGQHFGSRIIWLPDNTMLVAIGDGGNPPIQLEGNLIRRQAQNLRSHLGKIIRLNDDGSIPRDNPLATNKNANSAIWTYGHRNIQGLAFDPGARRIWSTEHGSRGGDELNLIQAGKNYGWPLVTHSKEYTGGEISKTRSQPGKIDPKVVWTPAIAPSGLAFYNGDRFPAWKGDLFAGGLVSQDVRRIDLDEAGNVRGQQEIQIGQRVRDVRQGPDGLLYILTDDSDGRLIRLEPTGG